MSKFKVGDRVHIDWAKTGYLFSGYNNTGTVRKIEGTWIVVGDYYEGNPGLTLNFKEDKLTLIPRFKVGDKVKIKGKSIGTYNFERYTGAGYPLQNTITAIRGDGSGKDIHNGIVLRYSGYNWCFTPQDLELLEETHQFRIGFRIGDRVRSKQPGREYTGTIVEIGEKIARVKRDDGIHGIDKSWWCEIKGDRIATAYGAWDDKSFLEKINKVSGDYQEQYKDVPATKPKPTKMQKLTAKLRRLFNANQRVQYRAGYIDECNDLTSAGRRVLEILQREALDEQLTEEAKKDLAEKKKEEKKEGE